MHRALIIAGGDQRNAARYLQMSEGDYVERVKRWRIAEDERIPKMGIPRRIKEMFFKIDIDLLNTDRSVIEGLLLADRRVSFQEVRSVVSRMLYGS